MYTKDLKKTIAKLPYYVVPKDMRCETNIYYYDINNNFIHKNHIILIIFQTVTSGHKLLNAHSHIFFDNVIRQVYPVITFRKNSCFNGGNDEFRKIIHSQC